MIATGRGACLLPASAIEIMVYKGGIVIVHCKRCIVERSQQIRPDVPNCRGIFVHRLQDILDVAAVQLEETGLHHLLRHILAVDPDRGTCRTDCIQHDFQQLVYPVHIQTRVMGENIQLKIFPK